jgi:hypothetical protein
MGTFHMTPNISATFLKTSGGTVVSCVDLTQNDPLQNGNTIAIYRLNITLILPFNPTIRFSYMSAQ